MAKKKIKVKILGVSAGHRKHMNTFYLVLLALKAIDKFAGRVAEIADIVTEIVDLADKEIKPCLNYCEWRHMPNKGQPQNPVCKMLLFLLAMNTDVLPKNFLTPVSQIRDQESSLTKVCAFCGARFSRSS